MDNNIKIKRHDAIQEIRSRMGGWFGSADGIFAGHPMDEAAAKTHLKFAQDNRISLEEIIELALGYFYKHKYTPAHQKKELDKIIKFFSKLK